MLLEQAAELQVDLRRYKEVRAAGAQSQTYRARATQFSPLARDLAAETTLREALTAAGMPPAKTPAKPGLRARALELLARFKEDRATFAHADDTVRFEFIQGVRNAISELRAANEHAWRENLAARAEAPSEDVLRALETIPSYQGVVRRLREAITALSALQAQTPAAEDVEHVIQAVEAARAEKEAALGMLQGSELPAEVLTFLRKSGQGGAALTDLTEVVEAWLERRDLLQAFRIVPAVRR